MKIWKPYCWVPDALSLEGAVEELEFLVIAVDDVSRRGAGGVSDLLDYG